MEKNKVISFFDSLAECWDENQIKNEEIVETILNKAYIKKGSSVLDIACGTGVLFDNYYSREVANLTGIDISQNMINIAREKYPNAQLICGDAETYSFERKYDRAVIYNAFPHFENPSLLFSNLAKALSDGGRLTVAHGMSREAIEKCHRHKASHVSNPLPEAEKLAQIMSDKFCVDTIISDDRMYIVSGIVNK